MKKPAKCTTPKRDREDYALTTKDLRNLTALVKEANDILGYYVSMPENETGELRTTHVDELVILRNLVDDLAITLDDVHWD